MSLAASAAAALSRYEKVKASLICACDVRESLKLLQVEQHQPRRRVLLPRQARALVCDEDLQRREDRRAEEMAADGAAVAPAERDVRMDLDLVARGGQAASD